MDPDTVACQNIIHAKSPFECFEIPAQETDPNVIRSLYLKIAVKIHPDKNTSHLATQAFQILSESFETLHDEDKQYDLLHSASSTHPSKRLNSRRRRKKRKSRDVADMVHQNDKWYTRDWNEVEAEIARMTNEFKEHLARKQEKHERDLEKKAERRQRKNKRIKKNLNFLYEKYGIDPSDSDSDSDSDKNTYNYISYIPDASECQSLVDEDNRTTSETNVSEAPTTSSKSESKDTICTLCRRSFTSDAMLQLHYEKSELHRSNLEKAANPWHKFKNSFSEVKDT